MTPGYREQCIDIGLCRGRLFPGINGEAYPWQSDARSFYGYVHSVEGMAVRYYVIQVAPGKETDTEAFITRRIAEEVCASCFHPVRHVRKKFRGEWMDRHEKLMPGYVFLCSEDAEELFFSLKRIPMLTKLLGCDKEFFTALTDREAEWLEALISVDRDGRITGEVPLSQIEISENDEIRILSGPLQGMEGMIKRINLHKRVAEVEVEFMGRMIGLHLGIELLEKKQK